jgi:hypothetical protein
MTQGAVLHIRVSDIYRDSVNKQTEPCATVHCVMHVVPRKMGSS